MEYPGTRFTRPLRLLLLGGFIIAFLIIAPLVILSTAGYQLDWRRGIWRTTGSISVDIEPATAKLILNGVAAKGKMPYRLNNLTPRQYSLVLDATGYHRWQTAVTLHNQQTIYFKDIGLLKNQTPRRRRRGRIDQLFLSPGGNYLITVNQNQNRQEIWLTDLKKEELTLLTALARETEVDWRWAEREPYGILSITTPSSSQLALINAKEPGPPTILNTPTSAAITKWQWLPEETILYLSTSTTLFQWSPTTRKMLRLTELAGADWQASANGLWLLRLAPAANRWELIRNALGFRSLWKTLPADNNARRFPWRLVQAAPDSVLVERPGPERRLLTAAAEFTIPGSYFRRSPFNDWWLLGSPWELREYRHGAAPTLLLRSGEPYADAVPLDEYNTLALVLPDRVTAFFPYYQVSHDFIPAVVRRLAADPKRRRLFFAGIYQNQEGLWELNY
ncbi:MAG: PEGA domain-containing protein [Candidatus Magasanikbacteria bacterium]|nr:PEGA domain-containing protein [Candidatus Magasanikbacteria bacterium]